MPVHDWTLVEAGIYHDFHCAWIPELRKALNGGLLPEGFYALAEQHAGQTIADVLTLHASSDSASGPLPTKSNGHGLAVAEAPPRVRRVETIDNGLAARRRTVAIRHVSGHRLIALIEILSPANKDRSLTLTNFVDKIVEAVNTGIHVLLVDLFPPGKCDPHGVHSLVRKRLLLCEDEYDLPADEPLTLASYAAGPKLDLYTEHLAVGGELPEMPLFLEPDRYISAPLEATYAEAYRGMPAFWRDVLEARASDTP